MKYNELSADQKTFISEMIDVKGNSFFREAAERVKNWNFVARGFHDFSEDISKFQKTLVMEEYNELYDLGLTKKNRKEIIDALCDLFVVGSYYNFLKGGSENICPADNMGTYNLTSLYRTLDQFIESDNTNGIVMAVVAIMQNSNFNARRALNEVLDSNDSKIPTVKEFTECFYKTYYFFAEADFDLDAMLRLEAEQIELRNRNRYQGVKGSIVKGGDGMDRVVFKDKNGKIMKPITYFEANLEGM